MTKKEVMVVVFGVVMFTAITGWFGKTANAQETWIITMPDGEGGTVELFCFKDESGNTYCE